MSVSFRLVYKALRLGFYVNALLGLASCTADLKHNPSVLIITVSNLGFPEFSCDTENDGQTQMTQGFDVLCKESIRFTHAYTPSLLSQPTLASLLTAQYPIDHGVRRNGNQYLKADAITVAEEALLKGYRTSFFSGGAPIWRMSGLGQGFEVFNDNVKVNLKTNYRKSLDNFRRFLKWYDRRAKGKPFLSVIYTPDLQYPQIPTATDLGVARRSTYQGQLDELSESLAFLIKSLKERGRWDNTIVFLVGLQGRAKGGHNSVIEPLNLYSEKSQVALLIKPSRKKRDLGLNWKIDKNVNLVDVGATLFEIITEKPPETSNQDLEIISLKPVFNNAKAGWDQERLILIESAWGQWRIGSQVRFALRKGKFLNFIEEPLRIFNTLVDPGEQYPLSPQNLLTQKIQMDVDQILKNKKVSHWTESLEGLERLYRALSEMGKNKEALKSLEQEIALYLSRYPKEKRAANIWANISLKKKDWKRLRRLAIQFDEPAWRYVAEKNLKRHSKTLSGSCVKYFSLSDESIQAIQVHQCNDPLFMKLVRWTTENNKVKRENLKEDFFRAMSYFIIDSNIESENATQFYVWPSNHISGFAPSLTELYLALPEYQRESKIVKKRLNL